MRKIIQAIYHRFNDWLLALVKLSWKNSKITLSIFAIITLFLFANINKMKIVFSAEDLAGQGFASTDELKSIKARYQDGVTSLFVLSPPIGQFTFTTEQLCQIRKWYSFKRNTIPELLSSLSTFDFKQIKRLKVGTTALKLRIHNLLDLDCQTPKILTDPKVVRTNLNDSPFAMAFEKKEQLSILFQFVFKDSTTSKFGSFDPALFAKLRTSAEKDLLTIAPRAKLHWIGAGDYQWYILEGFKFSKYINLGMIAFMLIGLRLFFGTWKAGFIYCGTLFISAIWVFGLKGFVGSSFDVLSTGLVLLLAISSLEDFTFTCYDQIKSKDWRKSVLKFVVPSFYTSLTTILGFWALRTSEVEAVRRMGTWAAWGGLVQWMLLFIFIPALLQQFPSLRVWGNPKKSLGVNLFSNSIFKSLPKKISLLSLIVYPLAVIFYSHMNYNEAPHHVFPPEQEYSKSINYLLDSKGWIGSTSLLFENNVPTNEMETIVNKILRTKEAQNLVVKHESPWEIKKWISTTGNLDQLESESYFNMSKASEQFVDIDKKVRVLFYLKETAVESVAALKRIAADICQNNCHLGGEVVAYSDFASLVPKTLIDSLFSSLIQVSLVICFVAIAQNKEKYIPSLLLSAFWGPFFIIMVLGTLNTTLDFWKSIFASILIGLAGDNAIQYLFGSENKNIHSGIEDRGGASIITALLMALSSLIYLGSYFSSPREFGVILSVGLLASLFGELWLFQGLMDIKIRRQK
ncbi:MAG: hypothetical protein PHY93_10345 [Bacteriovorax sp.]|nr:hypothetical protein [Bacteriovorax sp.]